MVDYHSILKCNVKCLNLEQIDRELSVLADATFVIKVRVYLVKDAQL